MAWFCKRCGECCSSPRIDVIDINRLLDAGYKFRDFANEDVFGQTFLKDKEGRCIFLKKDKVASCQVYVHRPDVCRIYPRELKDGDCKPAKFAFDIYLEKKSKNEQK